MTIDNNTIGALDLSEKLETGTKVNIEGYVIPTFGQSEMGDLIEIRVMEGSDEQSLFQQGSSLISSYNNDWVPGVGSNTCREEDDGWVRLFLKFRGIEESSAPVRFSIEGIVSPIAGITKVRMRVKDTTNDKNEVESASDETTQYLFKKTPAPEVRNFISTNTKNKTKPCTIFNPGEEINFSWQASGGYYRIYRGDTSRVIYEGTETSFEYPYGIQENTTFFLEASFTENKFVQKKFKDDVQADLNYSYKILPLTVDAPCKQTGMTGVQDKSGLTFCFCHYESKMIDYYTYKSGDTKPVRRRLECQADHFATCSLFQADRLPDGRVIVFSANGLRLCYQIQKELGKPDFGAIESIQLGAVPDFRAFPVSIQAICTGCSSQGMHIAVDFLDFSDCRHYVYTGLWIVGGEKLTQFCDISDVWNCSIGMNVTDSSADLYVASGCSGIIKIYDLFYQTGCVEYRYDGSFPGSRLFECNRDGAEHGLSSFLHCDIVKLKMNKEKKTYSLETVKKNGQYFGLGCSSLGWFYATSIDGVLKVAFDDGTYSFQTIGFISNGCCTIKYQSGPPMVGSYFENDLSGLVQLMNCYNETSHSWDEVMFRGGLLGGGIWADGLKQSDIHLTERLKSIHVLMK